MTTRQGETPLGRNVDSYQCIPFTERVRHDPAFGFRSRGRSAVGRYGMRLLAAALVLASTSALAAPPPCPQLRIIVPFSAGGASDFAARVLVDPLGSALKKQIVVENRAGATGNIGTAIVAKSDPDGCTLGI